MTPCGIRAAGTRWWACDSAGSASKQRRAGYGRGVEYPRPLTANERAVLERLIPDGGFDGADAYRAQLDHTTVVARCTCGCPTMFLEVDESAARSAHRGDALPLWGSAGNTDALDGYMDMYVCALEGVLTELQVMWYGSAPPKALPDPSEVLVAPGPEPTRVG
jgi:hypothetical protein